MNISNSAFVIRTHKFTEREKLLYEYASKYFGESNTFIACNTSKKNIIIPDKYNKVIFNETKILNDIGLFWHPDWSWRCGDYCYYALYNSLDKYEYIWLCEPDVYFCNDNSIDFFKAFENNNNDFLALRYGKARENSYFFPTSKVLEGVPMICLFGFTRIKTSVIKTLLEKRVELSLSFLNKKFPPNQYPNDEIFVSTTLKRMNYNISKIEDYTSFDTRLFTADENEAMILEEAKKIKGNFIIHPVLDEEVFLDKKIKRFNSILDNNGNISQWLRKILVKTNNKQLKKELQNEFIKAFDDYVKKQ